MRSVAALALVAFSFPAHAALCEPIARDLAFGNYTTGNAAPTDAVTVITINCTPDLGPELVSWSVSIGAGLAGNYSPRKMQGEEGALAYNIYVDASRTVIWGDGTQGTLTQESQLSLPGQTRKDLVVFGRIPPRQAVKPGVYNDVLIVAVDF